MVPAFLRSLEALTSRHGMRRVFKFLLKKRLGEFILGEIDLDQLEVEMAKDSRMASIQLRDLSLDPDAINNKLAGLPLLVKECSIASLSAKIPWTFKNCEIEVEELELVLVPFLGRNNPMDSCCKTDHDGKEKMSTSSDKIDPGTIPSTSGSVSLDVHEGVKTIAKSVESFLTSFNVRVKNIIIQFDPCSALSEMRSTFHKSLVLRITEIEFGTCVSEDTATISSSKPDSLLGIEKITNFVKFKGAVIEFLQLDDVDKETQVNSDLGTSFSQWNAESSPIGATSEILTGAGDGFSGKVNLSIPWKNGSLDIREVDADVSIEPVKLKLQPSTIEWIIVVWESLKNVGTAERSHGHYSSGPEPSIPTSKLQSQSSLVDPALLGSDTVTATRGNFSKITSTTMNNQETFPDSLSPRTHVIQNWVLPSRNEDERIHMDLDYGASIDQFFECFDELRSSQVSSGNSGIWNWTCSVFSAITVASNLASGSGHIPIEQHHVETSLRACIKEVSIILSFIDEEKTHSQDSVGNSGHNTVHGKNPGSFSASHLVNSLLDGRNSETYMSCLSFINTEHMATTEFDPINMNIQHLEVSCQNAVVNLKICQQKMKFDASVTNVRIDEYHGSKNLDEGFDFTGCGNSTHPLVLNEQLQGQVQGVLPPFRYSATLHDSVMPDQENDSRVHCSTSSRDGRVVLLESDGECSCQYAITYADTNGKPATSTSFSVDLPPLILWVHFPTVNMLLNLLKRLENHFDKTNISEDVAYDASSPEDVKKSATSYVTTVSSKTYLHGNIVLHQARIIVCFPSVCHEGLKHSTNLDKFIVFEHSPSLAVGGKLSDAFPISKPTYPRDNSCTPSTSIHLSTGDFNLYLVDAASKNASANTPFSAIKVLSVIGGKNDLFGITMLWQKGPVTGPWMVDRTWTLAASHGRGSRYKVNRDGCEFSSVTTAENHEQTSSHIRQELILSSSFFVHVHFSLVKFSLGNNDYKLFNQLLNQVTEELSNRVHDTSIVAYGSIKSGQSSSCDSSASQTSVLVDCDVLDICIFLDEELEVSNSMQKELSGSWNSLKLRIEKLELLSVIDIGEVKNAKFVWFNHGEGELWGSVFDRNEMAHPKNEDFLLLTCRNSTIARGAGEGANALSFGSAGTSITHLCNPQLSEMSTSIVVRCGTIVAPGGRTDWINAICLFFSSPPENDQPGNNGTESKYSEDDPAYKVSFFLDLVDVAVSYEPHVRSPSDISQDSDSEYSGGVESNEETGEKYFACLLAAASLSLSNHAMANSGTNIYNIQLQDVGLLISDLSGSKNGSDGYHAGYLQKAGYRKIAEEALIEAVLKIQDLHWEIESSDSHINLETCHDTTCGLLRLAAQLQQLYAPDMEDAVAQLQSRWNTIRQAHDGSTSNETTNLSDSSSLGSSLEMKLPVSEGDNRSVGLLDEIIENAFYVNGKSGPLSDPGNMQSHFQQDEGMPVETCYGPGMGLLRKSTSDETCADPFIESYYVSSTQNSAAPIGHRCSFNATAQREIETGKSGWYKDDCFVIVENHISKGSSQHGGQQILQEGMLPSSNRDSAEHCGEKGKIILKNTDVTWRMYAGLDWSELDRSSIRSSDSNGRDRNVCLELNLAGLNLQYDIYPEGVISVSKLSVSLQDINLYDRSRDAPWMMVLGYYSSKEHPRGSHAKALNLDLEVVRPEPVTPLEDYRLHLELLPLRLHLHQRQLNFLIRFFGKDSFTEESPSLPNTLDASEMSARKKTFGSLGIDEEALLPFFQRCDIRPLIVRVDYIPGHIDLAALRRGNYAELLNLVSWKGIDLHLKDVCAVGVYGWNSVCETVVGEWLEDISHNQVHKLLKGLAPLRSLSAVSSGTSKLVSLPIRSYREDHKLLKGMQRGALAFVKSISLEAVGLGVHLAAGAHEMLLQAEYILTSIPPSVSSPEKRRARSARSVQPEDARQGIQQAYESLSEGLGRSGKALLGGTLRAYQHGGGAGSALATAVRSVPAAAIAPISASARALHCALLGVRNSLDPERKKESMEKYLGPQGQKSGKKRLDS